MFKGGTYTFAIHLETGPTALVRFLNSDLNSTAQDQIESSHTISPLSLNPFSTPKQVLPGTKGRGKIILLPLLSRPISWWIFILGVQARWLFFPRERVRTITNPILILYLFYRSSWGFQEQSNLCFTDTYVEGKKQFYIRVTPLLFHFSYFLCISLELLRTSETWRETPSSPFRSGIRGNATVSELSERSIIYLKIRISSWLFWVLFFFFFLLFLSRLMG